MPLSGADAASTLLKSNSATYAGKKGACRMSPLVADLIDEPDDDYAAEALRLLPPDLAHIFESEERTVDPVGKSSVLFH